MKKPLKAMLSAICVIACITSCASNAKDIIADSTTENVTSETITETEPVSETIAIAKITFGDNNSLIISLESNNQSIEGIALATFDGVDLITEYEYFAATILYFENINILNNATITGVSGEDIILFNYNNGSIHPSLLMTNKYSFIPTSSFSSWRTTIYYNEILKNMTNELVKWCSN